MKSDNEIEEELRKGAAWSLDSTEHASIKASLLAHAKSTLPQQTVVVSPWSSWVFKMAYSCAALLVIIGGVSYSSAESIPGEPLYAVKVHVLEEMVALTKFSYDEKLDYNFELMETRLLELQELSEGAEDVYSEEDMDVLTSQITQHVDDVSELVQASTLETTHEEKIDTISKLSGVVKAQKNVVREDENLEYAREDIEASEDTTERILEQTVDTFKTEEGEDDVSEYLSDQMELLGTQLRVGTTSETLQTFATTHLHDAEESLSDGDLTEAIISVLEVRQEIDAEAYEEILHTEVEQ